MRMPPPERRSPSFSRETRTRSCSIRTGSRSAAATAFFLATGAGGPFGSTPATEQADGHHDDDGCRHDGADALDTQLTVLGVGGRGEAQPEALHLTLGDDLRLGPVGQLVDGALEARAGGLDVLLDPCGVAHLASFRGTVATLVGDAEVATELGHVAGRLDVVERVADLALLVDDEGRPDDAVDGLAVELLLAPGAVCRVDREVLVAEQRDGEVVALTERRELGRLVLGDADHVVAVLLQRVERLAEVAGLLGAARRHGGRVEVDDDLAAREVGEADGLAGVVGEAEGRRLLARLESCGHDLLLRRHVCRARTRSGHEVGPARADGGTRTRTPRAQEPKSCVST